ncbi:MAG: hypothetical protein OZ921_14705 [Sorangiineae bacterium]|nr:hypothetical protein [Polyangiaceae bacterium]MEB2323759.1 hypothetical protein [Sorangiineae bacterium]
MTLSFKHASLMVGWLGASAALTGCGFDTETPGDLGRASFRYEAECFLDCALDQPLAVGATQRIAVTGDGAEPDVVVLSSDDRVASFTLGARTCSCTRTTAQGSEAYGLADTGQTCDPGYTRECSNRIEVESHASGDAQLQLLAASGALIDTVTVHVREAASIALESYDEDRPRAVSRLAGHAGDSLDFRVLLLDEHENPLFSTGAVELRAEDSAVARVEPSSFGLDWTRGARFSARFARPGASTLVVSAAGVAVEVPVTVEE